MACVYRAQRQAIGRVSRTNSVSMVWGGTSSCRQKLLQVGGQSGFLDRGDLGAIRRLVQNAFSSTQVKTANDVVPLLSSDSKIFLLKV